MELLLHHTTYSRQVKALLATIISDCEKMLGPAPCKYAFCAYGALATEDMTLFAGIDMLLLLENDQAADWDAKPGSPAAEYFKNLCKLVQWQVHCVGETQTLGPEGDAISLSGFHFVQQLGANERLRGTTNVRNLSAYSLLSLSNECNVCWRGMPL